MTLGRRCDIAVFALLAAATLTGCSSGEIPPDHQYVVQLCIPPASWPSAMQAMQAFGAAHGLGYYGEVEPAPTHLPPGEHMGDTLNVTLVRGLHQFGGDDFDLWVTSDPFREGQVEIAAMGRQKITPAQINLANGLRSELSPLRCRSGA